MKFSEHNLEDIIFESSQTEEGRDNLRSRGLEVCGQLLRQVDLGSYGRADLVETVYDFVEDKPVITVYELKRSIISVEALLQAARYAKGVKRHFENENMECNTCIVLIGEMIDALSDFPYLLDYLESDVYVYTYSYHIDGIHFHRSLRYRNMTNETFNAITYKALFDCVCRDREEYEEALKASVEEFFNK